MQQKGPHSIKTKKNLNLNRKQTMNSSICSLKIGSWVNFNQVTLLLENHRNGFKLITFKSTRWTIAGWPI